jgi:hypothetical protein
MSEQALTHLADIVDRLGPNLWLVLDEVSIERYFGYGNDAIQQARKFADKHHATFATLTLKDGAREIIFGRAYYKADKP